MNQETTITTDYDKSLLKLDSFKMRPFLLPHIGNKLKGILFIMESHYIDIDFFQHQYNKIDLNVNKPELESGGRNAPIKKKLLGLNG